MATPAPARRRSVLDRPVARVAAFGVFLLVVAALAFMHREDLLPARQAAAPADDPAARCLAKREADIAQMRADGVIDDAQAALFKSRAEALCEAQAGGSAGPPPLPAN